MPGGCLSPQEKAAEAARRGGQSGWLRHFCRLRGDSPRPQLSDLAGSPAEGSSFLSVGSAPKGAKQELAHPSPRASLSPAPLPRALPRLAGSFSGVVGF